MAPIREKLLEGAFRERQTRCLTVSGKTGGEAPRVHRATHSVGPHFRKELRTKGETRLQFSIDSTHSCGC
jgi:hypothetical protein